MRRINEAAATGVPGGLDMGGDTLASRVLLPMTRVFTPLLQRTDRRRWAHPGSFHASWEPRTRRAAALVPNDSRVIEFGAGRRTLERYLDPSCSYVASDLVDRGPETILCDLNRRPLPDLGDAYDVAVFMGVLEYLRDLPSLLDWLAKHVAICVVSYACADAQGYSPRAMLEAVGRLRSGWLNSYGEQEFRSIFAERGFVSVHEETWRKQRLFVFAQPSSPRAAAAFSRRF